MNMQKKEISMKKNIEKLVSSSTYVHTFGKSRCSLVWLARPLQHFCASGCLFGDRLASQIKCTYVVRTVNLLEL